MGKRKFYYPIFSPLPFLVGFSQLSWSLINFSFFFISWRSPQHISQLFFWVLQRVSHHLAGMWNHLLDLYTFLFVSKYKPDIPHIFYIRGIKQLIQCTILKLQHKGYKLLSWNVACNWKACFEVLKQNYEGREVF